MKPEGPTVHLIDFGSATRMTALSAVAVPLLESSLAYTSPEQTGRMDRTVDHRTDFYSLGVTLYELLTGTLPFTSIDPMELVHSHIARLPLPPHQLSPAIPEPLSALVMKLLAKAPEDRYQSAYGVRADLKICLAEWQQQHAITPFVLGQRDHSTELRLSQKLYGRNRESAARCWRLSIGRGKEPGSWSFWRALRGSASRRWESSWARWSCRRGRCLRRDALSRQVRRLPILRWCRRSAISVSSCPRVRSSSCSGVNRWRRRWVRMVA